MALSAALSAVSRLGVGAAGVAFIGNSCLYDVGPGHKAVIFDKMQGGCQKDTPGPGTHFKVPFVQDPHIIDCRCRPQVQRSAERPPTSSAATCRRGRPQSRCRSVRGQSSAARRLTCSAVAGCL